MKAIRHTGIVVSDMERSLKFYRDLLGFKEIKRMEESGGYIDTVLGGQKIKVLTVKMSADDGNLIELLSFGPLQGGADKKRLDGIGLSHIAFTVNDLDKQYRELTKKGIKFNSAPQKSPDGYAKVAFCEDPDGTFLELVEVLK